MKKLYSQTWTVQLFKLRNGWVISYRASWVKHLSIHANVNSLRPSDAYYFRRWLIAWTGPSHYPNHCWNIVNWTLKINFSEIVIKIHTFSFKKIHLKVSSGKWRPLCLDLSVWKPIHVQHEAPSIFLLILRYLLPSPTDCLYHTLIIDVLRRAL